MASVSELPLRPWRGGKPMRSTTCVAWLAAALLCAASQVFGQTNDGYVGIYANASGTSPCTSVPLYTSTTLYVIAKTAGGSANGITGAEFRIEVSNPAGWFISYNAPAAANVVMGNPIDTDPDPNVGGGVNLAFRSCQVPI